MVRVAVVTMALVVLLAGGAGAGASAGSPEEPAPMDSASGSLSRVAMRSYAPAELVVRFKPATHARARASVRRGHGAHRLQGLPVPGLQLVRLRRGASVRAAAAAFERDPEVLYAEPNFYYTLTAVPNDPRFGELWGLNNTGQPMNGVGGATDADIDAPEAWNITTGSNAVTVAVADSGVAYDHPDLRSNIWKNPGESGAGRESNGRDDDHDGVVDDWRGWDFVSADNDPRDMNGHGTHVAGTIGARGDNGTGIAGVSWRVKLMPLRVADGNGVVTGSAVMSAFDYAARKGARVVNASFGSSGFSWGMLDAIRRHPRTLFVTAAGNGGDDGISDDNDKAPQFPCNYPVPNLICVAASDRADRLTSFSNYGARSVDVVAPGSEVLSAEPAYSAPAFSDGFESDFRGTWITGGANDAWDRITTVANSGSYSLSDSPAATYLDDTDSFARTASPFSLSGRSGCRLNYALRLATEPQADELLAEVSHDASTWALVSELSGSTAGAFLGLSDDLSDLEGSPTLYLRFHLVTNGSVTADGAQIDDVDVRCLSSSFNGNELSFRDGTSMAAPHVSGTAALIFAAHPTLGAAGVKDAILRGADRKAVLAGKTVSGGRLNAHRALIAAAKLVPTLDLRAPRVQHGLARGAVVVYARCGKTCALVATGSLSVLGSSEASALEKVARSLGARRRRKLVLRVPRRALVTAGRALGRGHRVTATVTVTATDRHGNSARGRRRIRLKR